MQDLLELLERMALRELLELLDQRVLPGLSEPRVLVLQGLLDPREQPALPDL